MNPSIERVKLIFIGIFAVVNLGLLIWTLGWVRPEKECVESHKWWDAASRACGQPILTSDITGRVITDQKARNEALRAIGRMPAEPSAPTKP